MAAGQVCGERWEDLKSVAGMTLWKFEHMEGLMICCMYFFCLDSYGNDHQTRCIPDMLKIGSHCHDTLLSCIL